MNIVICSSCLLSDVDVTEYCDIPNCLDHWCRRCMDDALPVAPRRAQKTLTGPMINDLFG